MGWNDRHPELYEAITGLSYATGRTLTHAPETCEGCSATGDQIESPIHAGQCDTCDHDMCDQCGTVEGDPDGNQYTCSRCA